MEADSQITGTMWSLSKVHLYLTLQHRGGKPGCHWALLVAPKTPGAKSPELHDAYLFHALDLLAPGIELTPEGKVPWRYERKPVNSSHVPRLVAKILIAKLPANLLESGALDRWAQMVDNVVSRVPVVQGDAGWNCVSWVLDALKALKASEGAFKDIVVMEMGDELEVEAVKLGDEATKNFFNAHDPTSLALLVVDWTMKARAS